MSEEKNKVQNIIKKLNNELNEKHFRNEKYRCQYNMIDDYIDKTDRKQTKIKKDTQTHEESNK